MLNHLRVRNLGVLEDAAIAPGPGLTVITGETGAGKTLLLDALRLLTGDKAKPAAVGPFGDEAVSEGLFEEGDAELGVTRLVPREGKSRAYLDGNLVAASVLDSRLAALVEIIGQHDQLLLKRSGSILGFIDGSLDSGGALTRRAYDEAWARHRSALDDRRRLGGDRMALERELDLVRHQANEISSAGLSVGDDARIEALAARLRNTETMRENVALAIDELNAINDNGGSLLSRLRRLAELDSSLGGQVAGAESLVESANDLARGLRGVMDSLDADPGALAQLDEQLTSLGDLKRKYGRTLEEVLDFGADAARRADELEGLLAKSAGIEELVSRSEAEVADLGAQLSQARAGAAASIVEHAGRHLADMGLASAHLEVSLQSTPPGPAGADQVELLFASDARLEPGPIHQVASGGELSRLVLALRLATKSRDVDTLVFDEVDAGVGGATAMAMGRKLFDLSRATQVLCVTHLPQVAAHADAHYLIERTGATATVRRLSDEERVADLTRMLAGLPDSVRGRDAASELLETARS